MKKKIFKKIALTLSFVLVLLAALAGCGQRAEEPSASSTPKAGVAASSHASSVSQGSQATLVDEEEPEDTAPTASQDLDVLSDAGGDTADTSASAPDELPPENPTAEPNASAASSSAENNRLSGIDLNVQFGDGDTFAMHLYDNETAAKIAEYVGTAAWQLPIYHYDDYDNWEVMQYYDIPNRYEIPSNPVNVTNEKAGTVYYSEPNRIVLFYQDAEIPSEYTPVGYIEYSQAFADAVRNNPVVEGWGNKLVHISNGR